MDSEIGPKTDADMYGNILEAAGPDTASRRPIFRFFDLPREIRDMVYAHASKTVDLSGEHYGFATIQSLHMDVLAPNLLRVSKPMKQELEDTLKHNYKFKGIRITAIGPSTSVVSEQIPLSLAARLASTTVILMTTTVEYFKGSTEDDLRFSADVAKLLGLLPNLRYFDIDTVVTHTYVELTRWHGRPISNICNITTDHPIFSACKVDDLSRIILDQRLIVYSPLFSPKEDALDPVTYDNLRHRKNRSNTIYFEASLSTTNDAWCGLNLEVMDQYVGSFEKAMVEARALNDTAKLSSA